MPRATNSVASRKRRKKILKAAKGYFGARSNVYTVAKNAVEKGLTYAYRDRKNKKREFRRLWIARINAAARQEGTTYSVLINNLAKNNVELNRKVLADLSMNNPDAFAAVVAVANGNAPAKKAAPKKAAPKKEEAPAAEEKPSNEEE